MSEGVIGARAQARNNISCARAEGVRDRRRSSSTPGRNGGTTAAGQASGGAGAPRGDAAFDRPSAAARTRAATRGSVCGPWRSAGRDGLGRAVVGCPGASSPWRTGRRRGCRAVPRGRLRRACSTEVERGIAPGGRRDDGRSRYDQRDRRRLRRCLERGSGRGLRRAAGGSRGDMPWRPGRRVRHNDCRAGRATRGRGWGGGAQAPGRPRFVRRRFHAENEAEGLA